MTARRVAWSIALITTSARAACAQGEAQMFRGGPAHPGTYASVATPKLDAVAWKFQTGGRVISSPAIAGNTLVVGSTDHRIYALDAARGSTLWTFETEGPVTSSPAIGAGLVYAGSLDGGFYAIDLATGKQKWKFQTRGERRFTAPGIHGLMPSTEMMPDPFDVFISSPVLAGGRVYFGSGDGGVYALDAATGKLAWRFATGNVVHATPAVVDGTVYVGSWDRNLYALDAATGRKRWAFQTGQDTVIYNQVGFVSSPAVAGGTVFVGCRDGFFYAVDARTGKQKWRHDNHHGWVIGSPAVAGDAVYFATSDGRRFKALDAATGAPRWDIGNKAISFSSPILVNGTVFFGSSDGVLHALDAATGKLTAEFQTDGWKANAGRYLDSLGHFNSTAMYSDRTLDATMIGVDRMFSLGAIISSPVVRDGVLYVGSADGRVYALR